MKLYPINRCKKFLKANEQMLLDIIGAKNLLSEGSLYNKGKTLSPKQWQLLKDYLDPKIVDVDIKNKLIYICSSRNIMF